MQFPCWLHALFLQYLVHEYAFDSIRNIDEETTLETRVRLSQYYRSPIL